jgi:alpha-ketoglutarate-dependent 2,4-dichlorophenoxyacetate dioxygenase
MSAEDKRLLFNRGNQLWHTDSSFKFVPARCSLLSAREIPPAGGETEFADLRAAYDALPEERQRALDGLVAEHSIFRSRALIGFTEFNEDIRNELPPVPQLIVRRHAGSGRKTLYLASHASHIVGWPVADGRLLLLDLNTHATQRDFVYSHTWRVGDLVIWDNRWTMHRGRPHDENQPRDLRRATTLDTRSTLAEEGIT